MAAHLERTEIETEAVRAFTLTRVETEEHALREDARRSEELKERQHEIRLAEIMPQGRKRKRGPDDGVPAQPPHPVPPPPPRATMSLEELKAMAANFKDSHMVAAELAGPPPVGFGVVHRQFAATNGLATTPQACKAAFLASGLTADTRWYAFQGTPYTLRS